MNSYDLLAERFYAATFRILGDTLKRGWVAGRSKALVEAEIYAAAREAALREGQTMDAAYAMAAYALWTVRMDHPVLGMLAFRDMP